MPVPEGKQEAGIEGGKGHINKYVTIDNRAQAPEGSMSEVVTPPPHNEDTLHQPV